MLQSAIGVIYPPHCPMCDTEVAELGGLCGPCWRETPFIQGLCCEACGAPLMGEDDGPVRCDDCLVTGRPWDRGRAALVYRDKARKMVLLLKHGDRLDLVRPAAEWMAGAGAAILSAESLLVPIPIHWRRLFKRRYNQAALLAREIARLEGCEVAPRALVRPRATRMQDDKGVAARFADLAGALVPHPRRGGVLAGRDVVLIDDVLTSGATLAAATEACRVAKAARVEVLILARVVRDD